MEPHRVLQEIPDSYKRVIFMSICGAIRLSLDSPPSLKITITAYRTAARTELLSSLCRATASMAVWVSNQSRSWTEPETHLPVDSSQRQAGSITIQLKKRLQQYQQSCE